MKVTDIEIPEYQRDLVFVAYDDKFNPQQVEELIRDGWVESTDEWISEARWSGACQLADELLEDVADAGQLRDGLIERIIELDTSTPYKDLLGHTGHMLFRYSPHEDDMAWLNDELDDPAAACTALGLDPQFLPWVEQILPEIAGYRAEGGGWFGATFLFSCNPVDLWGSGPRQITVTDPFLWLTNPWSGNGYGETAKGCTVNLPMDDVHVDKYAWGYGADDVFGGLLLPDSTITVSPLPESEED